MELVYIWAKTKDKEYNFNFSKEHDIKYNSKEKRISLTTKKSQINLFSENKDKGVVNQVYALIGKNGSGKTTLLRTFLEYDYLEGSGKIFEIMCLFKDEDYKIYTNDFIRLDNEMYINIKNKDKHYTPENLEDKLAPIYYNPYLGNYLTSSNIHPRGDISYERRFSNSYRENCFKDIWSEDIKSIYTMFNNIKEEKQLDQINNIITGKVEDKNYDSLKEIKFYSFVQKEKIDFFKMNEAFDKINNFDFENDLIKDIYKKILLSIIAFNSNLGTKRYKNKISGETNFVNIEKWVKEVQGHLNKVEYGIENKKIVTGLNSRIKDFFDFKKMIDLLLYLKGNNTKAKIKDGEFYSVFSMKLEKILNKDDIWNDFINLVSKGYIEIEQKFSDGEWSMLKLFANLYNELNASHNEKKNEFLVILDEGDMGFHPEWQRKYINIMINFFNKIFSDKKINLILASHSPFIASDLPKENVIFMGEDNKKELKTFGANIHELYKESFFLDSTMGEFSLSKIKEVIEDLTTLEYFKREEELLKKLEDIEDSELNEPEKAKKKMLEDHKETRENKENEIRGRQGEIKYIIDQIGERVLSKKLGEKYREVFLVGAQETEEDRLYKQWKSLSKEKQLELLKNGFGDQK